VFAGGVVAALVLMSGCESPRAAVTVKRPLVRLAVYEERPVSVRDALIAVYRKSMPNVDFESVPVREATVLEAVDSGTVEVGVSNADAAYAAYTGTLDASAKPLRHLRGMAMLWISSLHLLARRDSNIRGLADLPRRGRVGIARVDTTARLALAALGIEPAVRADLDAAAAGLKDGSLDAVFFSRSVIPSPAAQAAVGAGARLVPITGDMIERVREFDPFYQPTTIADGEYARQPHPARTFGVQAMLLCRSELPEPLVYELTKTFLEFVTSTDHPPMPAIDMELAPATPIPLHAGAARYYRERELFR
jgi:TRAP transporter TAXI family solute receptor